MSEISKVFFNEYQRDNAVLIAYVTAGDPNPEDTVDIAGALVKGGADIIELGIPFSDPIADGPTIQAATVRALNAGTTVKKVDLNKFSYNNIAQITFTKKHKLIQSICRDEGPAP